MLVITSFLFATRPKHVSTVSFSLPFLLFSIFSLSFSQIAFNFVAVSKWQNRGQETAQSVPFALAKWASAVTLPTDIEHSVGEQRVSKTYLADRERDDSSAVFSGNVNMYSYDTCFEPGSCKG